MVKLHVNNIEVEKARHTAQRTLDVMTTFLSEFGSSASLGYQNATSACILYSELAHLFTKSNIRSRLSLKGFQKFPESTYQSDSRTDRHFRTSEPC